MCIFFHKHVGIRKRVVRLSDVFLVETRTWPGERFQFALLEVVLRKRNRHRKLACNKIDWLSAITAESSVVCTRWVARSLFLFWRYKKINIEALQRIEMFDVVFFFVGNLYVKVELTHGKAYIEIVVIRTD